ncbi:MAG: ABC transporter ATP-binding protein/permease [Candidatus Heimdallarchaeota archaeon]|nr:ABC transporter ATP-binding protein/permease [Candidatus Heimdallarchaeota archaeon]MDH5645769.1 ABC transporter ATP-binding protein/permease [Candidatus Heimdallarchaeota archaeon]
MGWIYDGLDVDVKNRKYTDRELFMRIIKKLVPHKKPFFLLVTMVITSTIISLVDPLILATSLNSIKNKDYEKAILYGIIYFCLYILLFVVYFVNNYANAKMTPYFMVDLREGVFNKMQEQDLKFFDENRSGRLTARVGSDAADTAIVIGLLSAFSGSFLIIFVSIVILYSISIRLALMVSLIVPFVIIITMIFRKLARKYSANFRKTIANVNASIAESIDGIQIAKSYGREKEVADKFDTVNQDNYKTGLKFFTLMIFIFPTLDILLVISIFVIVTQGGEFAIQNQYGLDSTSLYLFIVYINRFFFPLMAMSTFFSQLQAGYSSYERLAVIEDSVPRVNANPGGLVIEDFKGEIKFENITFGYDDNDPVLVDFNLTIKPGEKLAIVGHTGAGKTTITNIISRFYEFQQGKVLVDGHDIRTLDLKEFRKNLGYVQQDPFLFALTVEQNIRYGNQDATSDELEKAIQAVHADEFIQYLPNGLSTEVGERGSRLSTGQRQLVCFARALLADPKILILDEATSAIDAYTETIIQEALEVLFKDRTSIIIAHRLSTIVNSDRIIVMDHGKIIEEGSHDALMAKGGKYQELYETYFKHQALEAGN